MTRRPDHIPPRKAIPKRIKAEAWQQADGRCQSCGITLHGGDFAYDHVLPVALGGKNELSNVQVLCDPCHISKTSGDVARISKADRQGARSGQYAKRKKRGTGQIKSAGFKRWRRFDGSIVNRGEG